MLNPNDSYGMRTPTDFPLVDERPQSQLSVYSARSAHHPLRPLSLRAGNCSSCPLSDLHRSRRNPRVGARSILDSEQTARPADQVAYRNIDANNPERASYSTFGLGSAGPR
jgi:hypothetical protein